MQSLLANPLLRDMILDKIAEEYSREHPPQQ